MTKTALTDKAGNFSFDNVDEGSYLVMATSVGHSNTYSNIVSISQANSVASVGVLQLVPLR
ncbi:MAG: hypothetical protein R2765_11020 [Ferruginibacter sp.]